MEYAMYDVTFQPAPKFTYMKMSVSGYGEYEAIARIKSQYPDAIIIKVEKR